MVEYFFLGRDGLTHNMLDNIHALWKRRRVCKIKCKGVCTVDMDNVRQQLEVGLPCMLFLRLWLSCFLLYSHVLTTSFWLTFHLSSR